ncbi:MAG: nucleoside monophosphate kinase [Candidatus Riflebacteria bacterium]|nr:nucleoside monophosphate kinase [Candidatus Riflebacteria bacterium]
MRPRPVLREALPASRRRLGWLLAALIGLGTLPGWSPAADPAATPSPGAPGSTDPTVPVKGLFISLAGSPGVGKTTHGERLARRYGIPHISVGKILRQEVAARTALGQQAAPYVQKGELVPTSLIASTVRNRLSSPDCRNGFILDGYPRKLDDLGTLEGILSDLGIPGLRIVGIEVDPAVVIERMRHRRVCERGHEFDLKQRPPKVSSRCDLDGRPLGPRADDTPEAIRRRFQVFAQETTPVLALFGRRGDYHPVNGDGSIDEVFHRLAAVIDRLGAEPSPRKPDAHRR